MSIHVSQAVWRHSQATGAARITLLALADFANSQGIAWPSIDTLATMVKVSARHIKRLIQQLEHSGELIVRRNASKWQTNLYQITLVDKVSELPPSKPVKEETEPSLKQLVQVAVSEAIQAIRPASESPKGVTQPSTRGDIGVTLSAIEPSSPEREAVPAKITHQAENPEKAIALSPEVDSFNILESPEKEQLPPSMVIATYKAIFGYKPRNGQAEQASSVIRSINLFQLACKLWLMAGHNMFNMAGILDWYHNLQRNELWRPYQQGKVPDGGSGSAGKGSGSDRQEALTAWEKLETVMDRLSCVSRVELVDTIGDRGLKAILKMGGVHYLRTIFKPGINDIRTRNEFVKTYQEMISA